MIKRWFNEYKSSLKMVEVEEILDLVFYRPLAFIVVKILYRTNLTPNQITFAAIIWAVIGAVLFVKEYVILAGIFFILYDVFDCADGMVARLKKNGTPIGRVVDGFADYIATGAAYLAIGFGFAGHSSHPQFYWILTIAAAASNIFHAVSLDYYRNRFLDYAFDRNSLLGDDLAEHLEAYNDIKDKPGNYFAKLLYKIYFVYSKIQLKLTVKQTDNVGKIYDKKDFLERNKFILRLWTFIGPTTELTFFIITAMTGTIEYYLWGMVTFLNIYAILLHITQFHINSITDKATQ